MALHTSQHHKAGCELEHAADMCLAHEGVTIPAIHLKGDPTSESFNNFVRFKYTPRGRRRKRGECI